MKVKMEPGHLVFGIMEVLEPFEIFNTNGMAMASEKSRSRASFAISPFNGGRE
jgi:hypothetical protein